MLLERVRNQPAILRCVSCGRMHKNWDLNRMYCVLCEKLILKDRSDFGEMKRLMITGELELRSIDCSSYEKEKAYSQLYPVCGDCIRKEKAEDKEEEEGRKRIRRRIRSRLYYGKTNIRYFCLPPFPLLCYYHYNNRK